MTLQVVLEYDLTEHCVILRGVYPEGTPCPIPLAPHHFQRLTKVEEGQDMGRLETFSPGTINPAQGWRRLVEEIQEFGYGWPAMRVEVIRHWWRDSQYWVVVRTPSLRSRFMEWNSSGFLLVRATPDTIDAAWAHRKVQNDNYCRGRGLLEWTYGDPFYDAEKDRYRVPFNTWAWKTK